MTPKEKATELVDKFSSVGLQQRNEGITCALIAVDEILNYQNQLLKNYKFKIENSFYEQVKQKIEKL